MPSSDMDGLSPLARGTRKVKLWDYAVIRFIPAGAGNTFIKVKITGSLTVYPRWRGEHLFNGVRAVGWLGLSPLARGTRRCQFPVADGQRFIPAGAGNTITLMLFIFTEPVYPRWRGEHYDGGIILRCFSGLSPLARGTPASACASVAAARFIPAGAGNTNLADFAAALAAVYPRWRGEHLS